MHCNQLVISIFPTTKCIALPENKKTSRDWTNQSVKVNFYVWTNLFSWLGDLPFNRIFHLSLIHISSFNTSSWPNFFVTWISSILSSCSPFPFIQTFPPVIIIPLQFFHISLPHALPSIRQASAKERATDLPHVLPTWLPRKSTVADRARVHPESNVPSGSCRNSRLQAEYQRPYLQSRPKSRKFLQVRQRKPRPGCSAIL